MQLLMNGVDADVGHTGRQHHGGALGAGRQRSAAATCWLCCPRNWPGCPPANAAAAASCPCRWRAARAPRVHHPVETGDACPAVAARHWCCRLPAQRASQLRQLRRCACTRSAFVVSPLVVSPRLGTTRLRERSLHNLPRQCPLRAAEIRQLRFLSAPPRRRRRGRTRRQSCLLLGCSAVRRVRQAGDGRPE